MKKKSLSLILVTAVAASMLMGTVFADDISWDGAFDASPAVETNNPDEQDVAVFIDGKETAQEEGLFSEEDAIIEEAIVDEEVAAEQTEFEVENASFEAADEDTAIISETAGESSSLAAAAQGLVYTGEPQKLLIVNAEQGYVEYSLDGENFSSEIPAATNAGLYTVYIRSAEGDLVYKGCLDAFYPSTDPLLFYQSVKRLLELDVSRVLPGHHDLEIPVSLITTRAVCRTTSYGPFRQRSRRSAPSTHSKMSIFWTISMWKN